MQACMKTFKLLIFMFAICGCLLINKTYAEAATDLGNSDCGHWDWQYLDDAGRLYIHIKSPDRDFGTATLQVSGLQGKQFYYNNYPSPVYLTLYGNPCGLRLNTNTAGIFPYTFCADCGSPYMQEFTAPFSWTMPAYYEFAAQPYTTDNAGTVTLDRFVNHRDFVWKGFYFMNQIPNGGSTLNANSFLLSASTFYDLGVRTRSPNGITTYPSRTITINLQKKSYPLQVNPNGGSWEGSTGVSTRIQQWGTTRTIGNPVPPSSLSIVCNANGGTGGGTYAAARRFQRWSFSGAGSLNGNSFTYGTGNTVLTASYRPDTIRLPSASKTGYLFQGWYTASSGGSKAGEAGSAWQPGQSCTLYAHWKPITYTVFYDGNGNTGGTMPSSTFTYDMAAKLSANQYVRDGCRFLGWNTNKTATTALYTDGQTIKNLTFVQGTTIRLYAIWAKDLVLTYDANGGNGAPAAQTVTAYNTEDVTFIISTMRPDRDGYEFLGWSLDRDTTTGAYQPGERITLQTDQTLYAIWYPILNIEAEIIRYLEPHDPMFQKGEKGILKIHVYGMCERVKVIFPDLFFVEEDDLNVALLNQEYYLNPQMREDLEQEFYIPLFLENGNYSVQVTAYKEGITGPEEKTVYPDFKVMGTILDELRTRIR